MEKKSIVCLMTIVVITSSIIFSGCVKVKQDEPEEVLFSFAEYMDEGKYEKACDLVVRHDTLEPYFAGDPSEREEMFIEGFGEKGEKIEIYVKVIGKEKIEDDKYVITMLIKTTHDEEGEVITDVATENYTVAKIDGEWKILLEEQPGFESVFAIAGLLVVAYLLRRRN